MTSSWTDEAKAAWHRDHEHADLAAPEAPVSHIVTYRPDIRIRVLVPPWVDADVWLRDAQAGWDDWLAQAGETWTEPAGETLIGVEVLGSTADVSNVDAGAGLAPDTNPDGHVHLAIPVEDQLAGTLRWLEETLLALIDLVAHARLAADTAGRLAELVDPDRSTATQPLIGLTEVVPLALCALPRRELGVLVAAADEALAPDAPDDVSVVVAEAAERTHHWAWSHRTGDQSAVRSEIRRAMALIQIHHRSDLGALARLHAPAPDAPRGVLEPVRARVTLTGRETAAYQRVIGRCLAEWRPCDPLARFLYEGR
jgi:hypothetical protein